MDAQQPLSPGAPPPDVTFCVRSDLCSPAADHVLRCVWHPDFSVDIELVHSQAVWRKQGVPAACPCTRSASRLTCSWFTCAPGVRRPDVQPISDAEWARRAREVLGEGRHTCEVVHAHDSSPKVSTPLSSHPPRRVSTLELTSHHVFASGCRLALS